MRKVIFEIRSHIFQWKLGVQRLWWRAQPAHKSAVPGALDSPSHWQSDRYFCQGGSRETVHHYLIWRLDTQMEALTPTFIDLSKAQTYQIGVNQDGRPTRALRASLFSDTASDSEGSQHLGHLVWSLHNQIQERNWNPSSGAGRESPPGPPQLHVWYSDKAETQAPVTTVPLQLGSDFLVLSDTVSLCQWTACVFTFKKAMGSWLLFSEQGVTDHFCSFRTQFYDVQHRCNGITR